jgi:hypothetical protein
MRLSIIAVLTILVCGCTSPVEQGPAHGSDSEKVKAMAEKALEACGKGNVKSVSVDGFQCSDKNNQ